MTATGSREVAWSPVYDLVAPLLGEPGLVPGAPAWCDLDDRDPAKWQALLWAAVWWAVSQDARQTALAEASRAISAAADWPAIARPRSAAYIPREVA
jgi:hypothetical protein